jgi:hypothetical protein
VVGSGQRTKGPKKKKKKKNNIRRPALLRPSLMTGDMDSHSTILGFSACPVLTTHHTSVPSVMGSTCKPPGQECQDKTCSSSSLSFSLLPQSLLRCTLPQTDDAHQGRRSAALVWLACRRRFLSDLHPLDLQVTTHRGEE